MSAQRKELHDIPEPVRLHHLGCSGREIVCHPGMGRETVRRYMGALSKVGLLVGAAADLPEASRISLAIGPVRELPQQSLSMASWEGRIG